MVILASTNLRIFASKIQYLRFQNLQTLTSFQASHKQFSLLYPKLSSNWSKPYKKMSGLAKYCRKCSFTEFSPNLSLFIGFQPLWRYFQINNHNWLWLAWKIAKGSGLSNHRYWIFEANIRSSPQPYFCPKFQYWPVSPERRQHSRKPKLLPKPSLNKISLQPKLQPCIMYWSRVILFTKSRKMAFSRY